MLTTVVNTSLMHVADLMVALATAAPPPLDPTNLIKDIVAWLLKILAGVGTLYFIIDLFKHVATSPRDLGAAGKDALIMVILLAFAAKGEVLIDWAMKAI